MLNAIQVADKATTLESRWSTNQITTPVLLVELVSLAAAYGDEQGQISRIVRAIGQRHDDFDKTLKIEG